MVSMTPPDTSRMTLLLLSAIYRLPVESSAIPKGEFSRALVAGPPSPLKPPVPLVPAWLVRPATVVIVPPETLRIRLLPRSAM